MRKFRDYHVAYEFDGRNKTTVFPAEFPRARFHGTYAFDGPGYSGGNGYTDIARSEKEVGPEISVQPFSIAGSRSNPVVPDRWAESDGSV